MANKANLIGHGKLLLHIVKATFAFLRFPFFFEEIDVKLLGL